MRREEVLGVDPVRPCLGRATEVDVGGVLGEPRPQRAGEVGVGHGALPVLASEIGGGVGRGFRQQGRVRVDLTNPVRDKPGNLMVEIYRSQVSCHIADVDPPAIEVERRLQPAGHHRINCKRFHSVQVGMRI